MIEIFMIYIKKKNRVITGKLLKLDNGYFVISGME